MIRWVKRLGFAAVAVWLTMGATPAHARFDVCNKSSYEVYVAFGYWDASQNAWSSAGWWTIKRGDCATVYEERLDQKKYYVYAESVDNNYFWKGNYPFCVVDEKFVIAGDSDCKSRGYYALNFFESDVGDQIDYQQDLVD
jgi:uncharacterized membrane protein